MIHALLSCALLLPAAPQHAEQKDHPSFKIAPLAAEDIEVRFLRPRYITVDDLLRVLNDLYQPDIFVQPSEAVPGRPGAGAWVPHFIELDGAILIRDSAKQVSAILKQVEKLEESVESSERVEHGPSDLVSHEYSPRFLPVKSLARALAGFQRSISIPASGHGMNSVVSNITPLLDRQLILVRETSEKLQEILSVLSRVDVPAPQMSLSILVISGAEGESSSGLPKDLVDHLGRMVPASSFQLLSTGILRGSVRETMSLEAESSSDLTYEMELAPAAYDGESRELTLRHVEFRVRKRVRGPHPDQAFRWQTQGFQTATSLRDGEYTVLGAVGKDPVFVVLRMTIVE